MMPFQKDQKVSLAIERPVTKERTTQVENLLTMMSNQPPSVVLEVDVKEILARYNQRLKQGSIGKQHSALRRKGDQPRRDPPKVSLDENKPEMVSIGMDREYLQEDLEKVPVKTYETSLARLQKQDDGGKDGKSITQMLQVDAQPSEAQPPPPQPQAESQPPPQPQPPSQPQAASQPQPSSQPQQQELLTAIMTPPPQPQQQPSSQPQQQELLTAIMTPPAQPQSQPPPQSQPQQQLTAIVAPPAQSPKPEPPAEPPKT
ncbi:hypothetical protein Y032_0001g91 [Ancylostoma ceylanicum]|uniref:Uncharacterized protein n=1 Tax=Ancylostoma ceylanicum TaxID=53326 RepID=A0A016W513_9BILA|nr:hypothetical protein Y032_0001g91 [Ancylostoma ceylanicum]